MTLRARVLVAMGVVAMLLVGAAVAIARTTETHLIDQVDARLRATGMADRMMGFGPRRGGGANEGLSSVYLAVVDGDGGVRVVATPNLIGDDQPLPRLPSPDELASHVAAGRPFTVPSAGSDLRYRALAVPAPRLGGAVVVALPLDDVDDAVARLVRVEAVVTLLVLAVLALVSWWVVRLGIRPVRSMTATASAIADGDLSRRVPTGAAGTEAGELGVALNRMLSRIQDAFEQRSRSERRLRQFVADASHELRTPVTTIRGYAELFRAGGLDQPGALAEAVRRTEQEAVRMGALVDDLLVLARLDENRPLRRSSVDLADLARDGAADAAARAGDHPVTAEADRPVVVIGDEGALRQVVTNLVGNALVHTPPGTPVVVRAWTEGDAGVVEVEDRGEGMPADVADRAFERFYRADPARSRHRGGTGLGLAIVKAVVEAHGGHVDLTSEVGRGTTVRVTLPGASPAAGRPRSSA